MKKIIYSTILIVSTTVCIKAQNTIPTTTVTGALSVNDSLHVTKNITTAGDITSKGEVIATDTMRAQKDILIDGNAKVGGDLTISGKSIFEQEVTIKKSLIFDSGNEFSYIPATATSKATFFLGNSNAKVQPWYQCQNPNAISAGFTQFAFPGAWVLRTPAGAIGNTNAALTMFSAPWDGNAFLEVEGVDNLGTGNNGLYLNHFCHRNTHINTNWDIANSVDGGTVYLGAKVDMQQSMRIGAAGSSISLNTSIEIDPALQNNSNGIKVNTSNPTVKVFSILRNDNKNTFALYGDGRAYFGVNQINANHAHANAQFQFDGKIGCKELVVVDPTKWADFVFDKNYKLLSLNDVEKFYIKNNHLPSVPSEKEVKANGINSAEMDAILLQKIEELTLYIVQQQKEINELKEKIKK